MSVFLIHGSHGNPKNNWFPWLKEELEKFGYEVITPQFPTPENQNLEAWTKVMDSYANKISLNTIFIGHSCGCPFILSLLEKHKAKATFLVSAFCTHLKHGRFNPINKTFVDKKFDWDKIKQNCDHIEMFHSDNDPYVLLEEAQIVAKNLDANITLIKGAGHFNSEVKFLKFEQLLTSIEAL